MKNIILCADDYGLNAPISQGIIDLLQRQRLSAVSCLTTAPLWSQYAVLLKPFHAQADLGLHFNLTLGKPVSNLYIQKYGKRFFPLSQLIFRAFTGCLDIAAIADECEEQLKRFVATLGFLPDFIDGHQHVHQLPQVRTALMGVYEKYCPDKKIYLRSVLNRAPVYSWSNTIKQAIIYLCGSAGFQRLLIKHTIPHNPDFSGSYAFSQAARYAQIFPQFLKKIGNQGLIMCHPGLKDERDTADTIAAARFFEYSYLSSSQFIQDCQAHGVQLVKGLFYSGILSR